MIKSCSRPTHRPPLWKHTQVFIHNQYISINQNSLKHYLTPPHINPPWLHVLHPPLPSLTPLDPNPVIWVYMANLTSIPACRAFAENLLGLPHSNHPKFPFHLNPPLHFKSLVLHLNCLSPHFKFYQPSISTLIQTSLYASDTIISASSFLCDHHVKSFLHC